MARTAKSVKVFMLSSHVTKACRYTAAHVQDLFTRVGLVGFQHLAGILIAG
jgi:hypothetical protein